MVRDELEGVAVGGAHDCEVATVQRGEFGDVEAFGDRDDRGVDEPEPEIAVDADQLDRALVVDVDRVDDLEPAGGDRGEEASLDGRAVAVLDQSGGFGDHGRRDRQISPRAQQSGAVVVAGFVAVSGSDEDAGVDQQHERSGAPGELRVRSDSAFTTDVERLAPPGRGAPDERLQHVVVMLGEIGAAFADPDERQLRELVGVLFGPLGERLDHRVLDTNAARGRCGLEPAGDLVRNRERHHAPTYVPS